ncbi:hypothetical protein HK100_001440 [Physocladia obscura]|uniref:Phytanoyl-CoA dioxygenase n=1 Tax=Physocladia obscura TaxID=109957 RepID=A0AAD5T8E1_9FUNG|nr:hypothetical protein HK100_001440 [Physocladia obscura]
MVDDTNTGLSLKQLLERDGYVIVDGLVSEDQMQELRDAAERVVGLARSGQWTLRRVVGVSFPPWNEDATVEDVWGVQHVMHPLLAEAAFARWYGSPALLAAVCEILDVPEAALQLELFNLLVNPARSDFALAWHRDDVRPDAAPDEELARLATPLHGTQWNTALYDDACLYVVPRSHFRPASAGERRVWVDDPLSSDMPGAIAVPLKAGQTVFYNNNILHRAIYHTSSKRHTLHACIGTVVGGPLRARNILQHGLAWMREDTFKQTLPPRLYPLYDNLIKLANENDGKELGYSQ